VQDEGGRGECQRHFYGLTDGFCAYAHLVHDDAVEAFVSNVCEDLKGCGWCCAQAALRAGL
jgi:hypothetical protein